MRTWQPESVLGQALEKQAYQQVIEAALDQRFPSPALKSALAQYLTLTKEHIT